MPRGEPVAETVRIRALPERVLSYFTDRAAVVEWLGEAAELEPRPGGRFVVSIRGETIRGEYVEVAPSHRLRVPWGRDGSAVLPPGSTELDITFEAIGGETQVTLIHRGLPTDEVPLHWHGWRHFLSRLARQVSCHRREPS